MYQASVGVKRGLDGQNVELDANQFLSVALMQQKLIRTEQALKAYTEIYSSALPNEIQVHPSVAAELQRTRKEHDEL
ncbi:hypothetical protein EON65_39385 [archaeon]|nr:MAG: hypothetical protein EON65_39385 [archaeon]